MSNQPVDTLPVPGIFDAHGVFSAGPGTFTPNTPSFVGVPPTITNFVPALGAISRLTRVQFDVLDDGGLIYAFWLLVGYDGAPLPSEVVYLNVPGKSGYCGRFSGGASAISGGLRLTNVGRLGGWPGAPKFFAYPLDPGGNLG